jgi:CDP-diacylglycerol pyrophosphatase
MPAGPAEAKRHAQFSAVRAASADRPVKLIRRQFAALGCEGRPMTNLRWLALGMAVIAVTAASPAGAAHPNALWRVVHDLCVIDMKLRGRPAPCLKVDRRGGFAVLKDLRGKTQVLLIPTARVSGIESPRLLSPNTPNYWQDAWVARAYFERRTMRSVPRDEIGLAINSVFGRSQNQLHIHIDCLRPDVKTTLEAHQDQISRDWSPFGWDLAGERYRARRLDGAELGERDPFKLLALSDPEARADMGRQTLAVVGATFADGRPGFILLAAAGGTLQNPKGASEELLDHECAILNAPAAGVARN